MLTRTVGPRANQPLRLLTRDACLHAVTKEHHRPVRQRRNRDEQMVEQTEKPWARISSWYAKRKSTVHLRIACSVRDSSSRIGARVIRREASSFRRSFPRGDTRE